jgi:AhpD family alkylhydroperoxidase
MKNLKAGIVASVIGGLVAGQIVTADTARDKQPKTGSKAQTTTATTPMSSDAVFKDIEATLGFVPQFFRVIADTQLDSLWTTMKTFQMNPQTALDAKTKELIGLAVAAQIPCEYCVAFHTEAAKKNGASDQEVRESVGMAATIRLFSTELNGLQIDKTQFKADVNRMFKDTTPKKRQAIR